MTDDGLFDLPFVNAAQTPAPSRRSQARFPESATSARRAAASALPAASPGQTPAAAIPQSPLDPMQVAGPVVWSPCHVCHQEEHNGDGSRILCEMQACAKSFHVDCLPERERSAAKRCIKDGKRWCCHFCRPAMPVGSGPALIFVSARRARAA
jgi:hypothetical protein